MIPRHRSPVGRSLLTVAAALALLVGCSSSDSGDDSGATTTTASEVTTTTALAGVLTPTESVIAGQCLDEVPVPAQQTYAVLVIPCEDPHIYEVYAQTRLDAGAGAEYPGALAVSNDAEARCFEVFPEFMGVTWEQSDYDIQTWWPSEQSWVTKRDRTVLCAVYKVTGGRTKGSVRGSAQ